MVCSKPARVILIIFNLLFWIFGLILLALGLWVKFDPNSSIVWQSLPTERIVGASSLSSTAWSIIIAGSFTIIVGAIGCWGALSKSKVLLSTYIIIISVLLIISLVALILVSTLKSGIENELNKNANKSALIKSFLQSNQTIDERNKLQQSLKCCGVSSPTDYDELNMTKPASCYPDNQLPSASSISNNITQNTTAASYFQDGCGKYLVENLPILNIFLFIMIIIEFAAIMFSMCLCAKSEKDYEMF